MCENRRIQSYTIWFNVQFTQLGPASVILVKQSGYKKYLYIQRTSNSLLSLRNEFLNSFKGVSRGSSTLMPLKSVFTCTQCG